MVRQAHHERNQLLIVRGALAEGLIQRFPSEIAKTILQPNHAAWHQPAVYRIPDAWQCRNARDNKPHRDTNHMEER